MDTVWLIAGCVGLLAGAGIGHFSGYMRGHEDATKEQQFIWKMRLEEAINEKRVK